MPDLMRIAAALGVCMVLSIFASAVDGVVMCQPNLKIIRGCNTCVCNAEGSALKCTKKACPPNSQLPVPEGAVSGWDTVCKPKSTFEIKDQCSKCTCQESGNGFGCEEIEKCVEKNPQKSQFNMDDFMPFKLPTV